MAGFAVDLVGGHDDQCQRGRSGTCPLFSGNGDPIPARGRALKTSWITCLTRSSMAGLSTPARRSVSSLFRFGLRLKR